MKIEIQTITGKRVNPFALKKSDISLLDIAHALSHLCRFTGHTRYFYPVAAHALLVADIVRANKAPPEVELWALHHDDAEAYLGDIASPLKRCYSVHPDAATTTDLWEIERKTLAVIGLALKLPRYYPMEIIKAADHAALCVEGRKLMPDHPAWLESTLTMPLPRVWGAGPLAIRRAFIDRHIALGEAIKRGQD